MTLELRNALQRIKELEREVRDLKRQLALERKISREMHYQAELEADRATLVEQTNRAMWRAQKVRSKRNKRK